ncbi:MAG: RsbRD N-terminal domain-containing protein [Candidatus Acidiferrum sp.]
MSLIARFCDEFRCHPDDSDDGLTGLKNGELGEDVMNNSNSSGAGTGRKAGAALAFESVADILERELQPLIEDWLRRVKQEPDLTRIPLSYEERTRHLPHLLHDVISRLRLEEGTKAPISQAAAQHGDLRHKQGYTVAMAVEESRLLQVSIFTMLHKNENRLEFSSLLADIVTIADEVDAQLKEQMLLFMAADIAAAGLAKPN